MQQTCGINSPLIVHTQATYAKVPSDTHHMTNRVHNTVETQTLPPPTEEREIQTDAIDSKNLMLQMGRDMTAKVFA